MRFPTIRTARAITKQGELEGCLVIGFGGDTFGAASYGSTKARCDALGRLLDFISEAIERGEVDLGPFDGIAANDNPTDEALSGSIGEAPGG